MQKSEAEMPRHSHFNDSRPSSCTRVLPLQFIPYAESLLTIVNC